MTDYTFNTEVLRGQMADVLAENEEQFLFVLTNALSRIVADEVIEMGRLGDEADPDLVVGNLRKIADAIEAGEVQ